MMRFTFAVLIEIAIGFALAAVLLAIALPLLLRHDIVRMGDAAGAGIVLGTVCAVTAAVIFRRGSAINRFRRKEI